MKLVDDAKDFWKWHSTHVAAILAAAPFAWSQLPDDLKAQVPSGWLPYISVLMFVAFLIGRVRQQ